MMDVLPAPRNPVKTVMGMFLDGIVFRPVFLHSDGGIRARRTSHQVLTLALWRFKYTM